METAAIPNKKAMCPSGIDGPDCREKFHQARNEKLHPILSPQGPQYQPAISTPIQGEWTRDNPPSHLIQRASMQPSENAIYLLTVGPASQEHLYSSPANLLTTGHWSQQLPTAPSERELDFFNKELASSLPNLEMNAEEELLQICASDLLLECPVRKRPRLLPPNRKMHVEVWKKQTSPPVQESARSPVPLEYSHLVDTMPVTNPADLSTVESFYRRVTSRARQVNPPEACLSPAWGVDVRRTDKKRQKQHQQLSMKRIASSPDFKEKTKWSMNISEDGNLPPKKRYTKGCL
ncbi:uncharacterized protein LOC128346764 isoform X2 [Hemicordylus capensis]|nr:uncharacterized protein LOC128346764 isoform X2 [Hemicordylus capensis]